MGYGATVTRARSSKAVVVAIASVGTVSVIAYAVLAGLQILVLNPLAAASGRSLEQIHADVAAAGESLGSPFAVSILSLGVALALLLLTLLTRLSTATPIVAGLAYALLLALGAPAYFLASFSAGMGLADTYGISGADYSRWSLVLYVVSGLALVTALALGMVALTRRRRPEPVVPAG